MSQEARPNAIDRQMQGAVGTPIVNDLTLFDDIAPPADVAVFRAEHAEAIRVLGKRVMNDIIEIGQRLIAVRKTCAHGEWLGWLRTEFGWSERGAYNFIQAAEAFGSKVAIVASLPIDASALYLLSGPTVPEAARDAAVTKAEAGEHITRAKAAEMVAEAQHKTLAEAAKAYREEQASLTQAAIAEATQQLRSDADALHAKLAEIDAEAAKLPNIEAAICTSLGQKKLTEEQYRNLAMIFNQSISAGGKTYPPISRERQHQVEENLRVSSAVTRALETLAGAPPPQVFFDAVWPVQREQHSRLCPAIIEWLIEYRNRLEEESVNG